MARTAYSINSYTGGATYATIVATGIGAADSTITITGTNSSWSPLGVTGGWYLTLDYGTSAEEKVFVPSGSWTYANTGVTLSGIIRGIDDTTQQVHPAGAFVAPIVTSIDTSEANQLVSQTLGTNPVGLQFPGPLTVSGNVTVTGTLTIVSGYGLIVNTQNAGGGGQTLTLHDSPTGINTYIRANAGPTGGIQMINNAFSKSVFTVDDIGDGFFNGGLTVSSGINTLSGTLTISGTGTYWGVQTFENQASFPGGLLLANGGLTVLGGTNNILGTTLISGAITVSGTMQGNSIYTAPTFVASANRNAIPNEVTVFSGTTAAQTVFLPSGNLINGTNNTVVNYGTVAITVASGSTAQLNSFGVLGNVTLQQYQSFDFTYNLGNNTWYAEDSNAINASPLLEGTITISGTTNVVAGPTNFGTTVVTSGIYTDITVSGNIVISGSTNPTYLPPPSYLSPYKAWTADPLVNTSTTTLITGTLYYQAIWVPQPITLSGISFYPSTFAATDTAYLGFFNSTTQLAVCSGIVGGTTSQFTKALISGGTYQVTTPGLYYIGMVISGSSTFVAASPVVGGDSNFINFGAAAGNNTLANMRAVSVVIGNRALYTNNNTVSGTMVKSVITPFFALS
jgi:hypothetical protein